MPKQRNDPLDEVEVELLLSQPDDRPTRKHGFEILLGILGVTVAAALLSRDEITATLRKLLLPGTAAAQE